MKLALAMLAVLSPATALAQLGPDGFGTVQVFGVAPSFLFTAPAAGDYATLTAATGQTITCSRASTATYLNNAGTRVTAAANRCIVESVNTATDTPAAGGTPALRAEPNVSNRLLNSTAPVTQTTAALAAGSYTGWMEGSGSLVFTLTAGAAAGLPCTATAGKINDCHFTASGGSTTVTATPSGSVTAEQIENNSFRTSLIVTAGTVVTRATDSNTTPNAWNLVGPALSVSVVAQLEGIDNNLNQLALSSNVNYVAWLFVNGGANIVLSRDDSAATAITATWADASKTTLARYSLTRSGATGQASAGGAFGSQAALAAQAANPTTLTIGSLSGFSAAGIWIQLTCISATSATVCGP